MLEMKTQSQSSGRSLIPTQVLVRAKPTPAICSLRLLRGKSLEMKAKSGVLSARKEKATGEVRFRCQCGYSKKEGEIVSIILSLK